MTIPEIESRSSFQYPSKDDWNFGQLPLDEIILWEYVDWFWAMDKYDTEAVYIVCLLVPLVLFVVHEQLRRSRFKVRERVFCSSEYFTELKVSSKVN